MNRITTLKVAASIVTLTACTNLSWAAGESGAIETVVVSAEKRAEDVQKIPEAVTAISSDELLRNNGKDAHILDSLTSGLSLGTNRDVVQVHIRGVGSITDSGTNTSAVAFNKDGIYQPRDVTGEAFYDLAAVEILKGPQGTLYGRGATGGALNLNTAKPTDHYESIGTLDVGNHSELNATAVQNIPLTDHLQIRGALNLIQHQGYLSNGANDQKNFGGRLRLSYAPTEALSILLTGEYASSVGNGIAGVYYPFLNPGNPWFSPPGVAYPGVNYHKRVWTQQYYGQVDYNLYGVTLTYLPGYLFHRNVENHPAGNLSIGSNFKEQQTSHELRFTNSDQGRLKWLGGLYFYHDVFYGQNQTFIPITPAKVSQSVKDYRNQQQSEAIFGQVTYSIYDWLRATGGLRYSVDHRHDTGVSTSLNPLNSPPTLNGAPVNSNFVQTFRRVDWKVGIDADVAEDVMIYANIKTGYTPGGGNTAVLVPGTATVQPAFPFQPESLIAYSTGVKSRFFNDRLQVNNEFFYYNYGGFQVSARDLTLNTNRFFNADKVHTYGDDLDVVAAVTQDDRLNVSLEYLNATIVKFAAFPATVGNDVPVSPSFTFQAGYEHIWDLESGGSLVSTINVSSTSDSWYSFDRAANTFLPGHTSLNLDLTYNLPDTHWSVGAYCQNCTNVASIDSDSSASVIASGPFQNLGPGVASIRSPQLFGLHLRANY